ncbi:MAG: cytochrome c biogenesis heme-transporting ATPase CcmA [Alteromonadaceae bacterium]|nr:cytochrome c biogenesis heme-transporting ATPase CcmA [Alteromonadaceae bacterium]
MVYCSPTSLIVGTILLTAENLSCIKQDRLLFSQLNFSVSAGNGLYIKGENGAGKTSLLRILTGLSQPAEGSVLWQQKDITSDFEEYATNLVYLGHKLGLNGNLSAIDNLVFWNTVNSIDDTTDLYELLSLLGLAGLEDMPVNRLSAGQQRRVSLARLWLKPAALWILDEPFNALDVQAVELLIDKIKSHITGGGSLVITSHLDMVTRLNCDVLHMEYNI